MAITRIILLAISILLVPSITAAQTPATAKPQQQAKSKRTAQEKLDQLIAEIRANHQPASAEEINDWYPIPADNAADDYLVAFDLIVKPASTEEQEGDESKLPFVGYDSPITEITARIPDGLLPKIIEHLEQNQPALTRLRTIDPTRPCRWPGNYAEGFDMPLPHLVTLRKTMQLLDLDSLLAVHDQDYEHAYNNIMLTLQLAETIRNEPLEISQIIRISMYTNALRNLESLMRVSPPAAPITRQLITHLKSIHMHREFTRALVGGRAITISSPLHFIYKDKLSLPAEHPIFKINKVAIIKILNLYIDLLNKNQTDTKKIEQMISSLPKRFQLAKSHCSGLPPIINTTSISQSLINTASTALSAHLYQLDNGTYPDSLHDLVPTYLTSIPTDLYTHQPLQYIYDREINSVVVYSTGQDETDNQGREYASYNRQTLGRKPSDEFDDRPLTDITFTIGNYQRVHFPEMFVKKESGSLFKKALQQAKDLTEKTTDQ